MLYKENLAQNILIWVILLVLLNYQPIAAALTGKVAGKIIDAESKEPLPGANIILEGTPIGTASDNNGNYFIIEAEKD